MDDHRSASSTPAKEPLPPPRGAEFTVIINNRPYLTAAHVLTGTEIKALAGLPVDYELYQIRGSESVPVSNEQEIHIHEGIQFRAIPAGTFGW
jgi:hypothetical protein